MTIAPNTPQQSTTQRVAFEGAAGQTLSGRLELPVDGRVRACAIFAHCFTCGKNARASVDVSRALTARGIAVLRFDFTGLGDSEGDFADNTLVSNVADIVAGAAFLSASWQPPTLLIGHSLGGAAVLRAAAQIPSIAAVATIGAPADPAHVTTLFGAALQRIETNGEADVQLGQKTVRVGKAFIDDVNAASLTSALHALDRPLLLLHSPTDAIVGIDNARILYESARHPKSFVALDGADHLLSDRQDSHYVAQIIAAWADRYLPPAAPADLGELMDTEDVVARIGLDHYRTEIRARAHGLLADEPVAVGGSDTGPSPYDLLLAALGACTAITLRMYADRKEWPLTAIRVRLNHRRVHAIDERNIDSSDARTDNVERVLELEGDLTADMRQRLLQIADRCPVHRTLDAGVHTTTTLAPGPIADP